MYRVARSRVLSALSASVVVLENASVCMAPRKDCTAGRGRSAESSSVGAPESACRQYASWRVHVSLPG